MQLFEVQKKAITQANGKPGYFYAMEMGLGKTAVCINEWMRLRVQRPEMNIVIGCPNTLKSNWARELAMWGYDGAVYIHGVTKIPKKENPSDHFKGCRAYVFNYEALLAPNAQEMLNLAIDGSYLVWDESTQLKNQKAQRTRQAIIMAQRAAFRRALSGAPVTQGPHDFWSQLRAVGELPGYNYFAFRNRFCRMGGFMSKRVVGVQNSEELDAILAPYMFRAKKSEWTDLPEKMYTTRTLDMSPPQKAAYKEMFSDFCLWLGDGTVVTAEQVVTKLMKLQQISSGFIYDENGTVRSVDDSPSKLEEVIRILGETSSKVIIFAVYVPSIERILARLREEGIGAVALRGGMASMDVDAAKDLFNNDPNTKVIVVQQETGKYGHTLLGSEASGRCFTTIFYENSYSLDSRLQAEDRNHRHGQTNPVLYIDLVSSPVEDTAIEAIKFKKKIADHVVDKIRDGVLK